MLKCNSVITNMAITCHTRWGEWTLREQVTNTGNNQQVNTGKNRNGICHICAMMTLWGHWGQIGKCAFTCYGFGLITFDATVITKKEY